MPVLSLSKGVDVYCKHLPLYNNDQNCQKENNATFLRFTTFFSLQHSPQSLRRDTSFNTMTCFVGLHAYHRLRYVIR